MLALIPFLLVLFTVHKHSTEVNGIGCMGQPLPRGLSSSTQSTLGPSRSELEPEAGSGQSELGGRGSGLERNSEESRSSNIPDDLEEMMERVNRAIDGPRIERSYCCCLCFTSSSTLSDSLLADLTYNPNNTNTTSSDPKSEQSGSHSTSDFIDTNSPWDQGSGVGAGWGTPSFGFGANGEGVLMRFAEAEPLDCDEQVCLERFVACRQQFQWSGTTELIPVHDRPFPQEAEVAAQCIFVYSREARLIRQFFTLLDNDPDILKYQQRLTTSRTT